MPAHPIFGDICKRWIAGGMVRTPPRALSLAKRRHHECGMLGSPPGAILAVERDVGTRRRALASRLQCQALARRLDAAVVVANRKETCFRSARTSHG
jgi:hypothetical protein